MSGDRDWNECEWDLVVVIEYMTGSALGVNDEDDGSCAAAAAESDVRMGFGLLIELDDIGIGNGADGKVLVVLVSFEEACTNASPLSTPSPPSVWTSSD